MSDSVSEVSQLNLRSSRPGSNLSVNIFLVINALKYLKRDDPVVRKLTNLCPLRRKNRGFAAMTTSEPLSRSKRTQVRCHSTKLSITYIGSKLRYASDHQFILLFRIVSYIHHSTFAVAILKQL